MHEALHIARPWSRRIASTSSTTTANRRAVRTGHDRSDGLRDTREICSGHLCAHGRNLSGLALLAGVRSSPRTRPFASDATAVCDDLWGSIPIDLRVESGPVVIADRNPEDSYSLWDGGQSWQGPEVRAGTRGAT